MFGINPRYFMMGDYIQYVRFSGGDNGGQILNERRFEGSLYKILPELENFIRDGIVTNRPVPVSILRETNVQNYPYKALRELLMNAVMHRDYQSNMPTRLYQYDSHIEIMNPGGLYGQARPENFPRVNDYRNSVVAEMMRSLNYVNMFNHGVSDVQTLLKENNSPAAVFKVDLLTAFSVVVKEPDDSSLPKFAQAGNKVENTEYEIDINKLSQAVSQVMPDLSQVQCTKFAEVVRLLNCSPKSAFELMNGVGESNRSRFRNNVMYRLVETGFVSLEYPDNPRHPQQKYILTEKGVALLNVNKSH